MPSMLVDSPKVRRDRVRVGPRFDEPETLSFRCGRTHWRVLAELADDLFDKKGLRSEGRKLRVEVVKSGPHRTVTRLVLPCGTFYVKQNRSAGWRALLRNLVRPSKAQRESNAAQQVAALGVATIETVAIGRPASPWSAAGDFLVTREIPGTQTVREYVEREVAHLAPRQQTRVRDQLAEQLGILVARLHRGGLVHHDLLAENILVRADRDGSLRLWLIDLQEVRAVARIGLRRIERNLSSLYNSLQWHATTGDRLRFFRFYWKSLLSGPSHEQPISGLPGDLRAAAHRVEAYCHEARRIATRHADGKWARGNRRLVIADGNGRRCRGLASLGSEFVKAIRDDPERLFVGARVLADSGHPVSAERVAAVDLPLQGGTLRCVVRAMPAAEGRWAQVFSGGRSWPRRAWEMGHRLLRRGIQTPRPLLFVESNTGDYLLTDRIAGGVSLSEYLRVELTDLPPRERERAIRVCTQKLAEQLRCLHEHCFDHTCLRADRILVVPTTAACDAFVLDAEKIRQWRRRLPRRVVVRRLAELTETISRARPLRRTEQLRFLKRYLGPGYKAEWKKLWNGAAPLLEPREKPLAGLFARAIVAAVLAGFLLAGCRTVNKPVTLPARHSVRSDQLLVLSDFKLPKEHPLLVDLNQLRQRVSATLDLPLQSEEVVVYLFSTELEYTQYIDTAYPGLPHRRAYFVGTPNELAVYTFWGDRIQEDLRHEYTHGLLHASMKNVPLWLDEGVAEYFEVVGAEPGTVNQDYTQRLGESLANGWRPDLKRLERIEEFSQMQRSDYEESWAWIHFMLHGSEGSRLILQRYLAELRDNKQPQPLSEQLNSEFVDYESRFLAYLQTLGSKTDVLTQAEFR